MPAIKLYDKIEETDPNRMAGISLNIPAEVIPDNRITEDIISDPNYQIMTQQEFDNYLSTINEDLLAWQIILDTLPMNYFIPEGEE